MGRGSSVSASARILTIQSRPTPTQSLISQSPTLYFLSIGPEAWEKLDRYSCEVYRPTPTRQVRWRSRSEWIQSGLPILLARAEGTLRGAFARRGVLPYWWQGNRFIPALLCCCLLCSHTSSDHSFLRQLTSSSLGVAVP